VLILLRFCYKNAAKFTKSGLRFAHYGYVHTMAVYDIEFVQRATSFCRVLLYLTGNIPAHCLRNLMQRHDAVDFDAESRFLTQYVARHNHSYHVSASAVR